MKTDDILKRGAFDAWQEARQSVGVCSDMIGFYKLRANNHETVTLRTYEVELGALETIRDIKHKRYLDFFATSKDARKYWKETIV